MNNQFTFHEKIFSIERFPKTEKLPLRAWDAADEYLVNYITQNNILLNKILIINDNFGFLSLVLNYNKSDFITDSFCSEIALNNNLKNNNLEKQLTKINQLDLTNKEYDLIILKVPKKLKYFEYQLNLLNKITPVGTKIIAAGMVKYLSNSFYSLFENSLNKVTTSKAVKKARLLFGETKNNENFKLNSFIHYFDYPKNNISVANLPNCFSSQKPDIGSIFLLDNLPKKDLSKKQIIDLGCGNGILAIYLAKENPDSFITGFDESYMAIESAKLTAKKNMVINCTFKVNNILDGVIENSIDLIVCNPPFHQNNTIIVKISEQMFYQAYKKLNIGGEFRLVFNRHLEYYKILKKYFKNITVVKANKQFTILSCVK